MDSKGRWFLESSILVLAFLIGRLAALSVTPVDGREVVDENLTQGVGVVRQGAREGE